MKRLLAFVGIAVAALLWMLQGAPKIQAQNRLTFSIVSQDNGHVALGLALRRLNVSGTFMEIPAHPDDEQNALFAMFTLGMGLRSIDLQANRGDGGQNEIGPELFQDMAVLRTSELLAAHRIDGAEQFFTRAIDYGYSFDPEEVIGKWGREEIVGDFVRLIRSTRPDVVQTMNIQGRGGDRAHEATTVLAREAYFAAGDPARYPDQIKEGLRPWQPKKLYFTGGPGVIGAGGPGAGGQGAGGRGAAGGRGGPGRGGVPGANPAQPGGAPPAPAANAAARPAGTAVTRMNTAVYDTLLGRTYAEIGADAHSWHKCQGTNGLPTLPGFQGGGGGGMGGTYQLIDTKIAAQVGKDETSLFDGIDTSLVSIAQYAGANPPDALKSGLTAISEQAVRAQRAFDTGTDAATAAPIEAGLGAVRALRSALKTMALDETARYEIDFRLGMKERDYEDAVLAAHGVTFDAVADDGLVVAGQPVRLQMLAANRGATDVDVTAVTVAGVNGAMCNPGAAAKSAVYTCTANGLIPINAKLTTPYFTDDYWRNPSKPAIDVFDPAVPFGVPFAPTPFHVTFRVKAGSTEVTKDVAVQYRYVKDIYNGDKRMELNVVPAFSVKVTPPLNVIPAPAAGSAVRPTREVHVSVTNGSKEPTEATVRLTLPAGWTATPASVDLAFEHEDESLSARFVVTAPAQAKVGAYTVGATVTSPRVLGEFSNGYQEIEYPHVQRRQMIKPAQTLLKVVNVKTVANLNVGYIMGVGDQVPPALEQLGAKVSFIEADELAWGNLAKYNVIITGVRAYERRADLRAYNRRLLDYADAGGTVIVQYNKFEFNQAQYGPFPAAVSQNRVSDETVPVKVLVPAHPVFNYPNKIGQETWANWVQERGLYFIGEKDPKYVDLISMTDSFKDNPGEKLGSLIEGRIGKGRWLYLGLGLWRQLPAGTDGAYQLLANLIALPKAPVSRVQ
jgi:hypothetical protein